MSQSLKEQIDLGKTLLASKLWISVSEKILKQRAKASRRCETDTSDIRAFQGEIRAYDLFLGHGEGKQKVKGIFENTIEELEEKWTTVK